MPVGDPALYYSLQVIVYSGTPAPTASSCSGEDSFTVTYASRSIGGADASGCYLYVQDSTVTGLPLFSLNGDVTSTPAFFSELTSDGDLVSALYIYVILVIINGIGVFREMDMAVYHEEINAITVE